MPVINATLLVVFLSFFVFMLLMKAIYFDPILRLKHQREGKLTGDRQDALSFAEEYARLRQEYETSLQQARKEAMAVIQDVRQQAKASAQEMLAGARQEAAAEIERQMAELVAWRETTYRQLEAERAALTRTIISKVTSGGRVTTARGA